MNQIERDYAVYLLCRVAANSGRFLSLFGGRTLLDAGQSKSAIYPQFQDEKAMSRLGMTRRCKFSRDSLAKAEKSSIQVDDPSAQEPMSLVFHDVRSERFHTLPCLGLHSAHGGNASE